MRTNLPTRRQPQQPPALGLGDVAAIMPLMAQPVLPTNTLYSALVWSDEVRLYYHCSQHSNLFYHRSNIKEGVQQERRPKITIKTLLQWKTRAFGNLLCHEI